MDKPCGKTNAGAAALDVSPRRLDSGRIWLAGYVPLRYAAEQLDPIMVRAVAIGEPPNGLLIVSADTCLVSPRTASEWARAIARRVPLPAERIFIVTTHTHSGPDISRLFGGVPPYYCLKFRRGVMRAAARAWAAREPAEMFVGTAEHDLGIPRRAAKGQTDRDRELVVLQWRAGSRVVATLINLGCHGGVLPRESRLLSSDLPGALCRAADGAFGGVSVFVPRIQGDVNPNLPGDDPYYQDGTPEEIERLAREGSEQIGEAVAGARPASSGPIRIVSAAVEASNPDPVPILLASRLWTGRAPRYPWRTSFEILKFAIGGIEGIAVPGEVRPASAAACWKN